MEKPARRPRDLRDARSTDDGLPPHEGRLERRGAAAAEMRLPLFSMTSWVRFVLFSRSRVESFAGRPCETGKNCRILSENAGRPLVIWFIKDRGDLLQVGPVLRVPRALGARRDDYG